MSADPIVYRSADPQVVKAWKDAEAAINVYVEQTQAVLDEAGLGRYQVYRNNGWSPGKFAGLAIPQDEFPPDGWRQNKAREYATPDKRLKAGKQIAAALEAVKHPGDPLHKLIGMPADTLSGAVSHPPASGCLRAALRCTCSGGSTLTGGSRSAARAQSTTACGSA